MQRSMHRSDVSNLHESACWLAARKPGGQGVLEPRVRADVIVPASVHSTPWTLWTLRGCRARAWLREQAPATCCLRGYSRSRAPKSARHVRASLSHRRPLSFSRARRLCRGIALPVSRATGVTPAAEAPATRATACEAGVFALDTHTRATELPSNARAAFCCNVTSVARRHA